MDNITTERRTITGSHFNLCGQFLHHKTKVDGDISPGLVKRLVRYAQKELRAIGIEPPSHAIEVYSLGYDSDTRTYHVSFKNGKGATYVLNGIMLGNGGWPDLDHGFTLLREK